MKTHFILGFLIGAAINLGFQWTDSTAITFAQIDLWELFLCTFLAALGEVLLASVSKTPPPSVAIPHKVDHL